MKSASFKFIGMNTIKDRTELKAGELVQAVDVDLDHTGRATARKGYRKIRAGQVHSVWCKSGLCLFGDGQELYRLHDDLSATKLADLQTDKPIDFEDVNGTVVFSNGVDFGFVESGAVVWPDVPKVGTLPVIPTPAGQLLAFYNGSLLVAAGDQVAATLAYNLEAVHATKGFTPLGSFITMLKAVDDGVWVSSSDAVYFMSGPGYDEVVVRKILDDPAIFRTAQLSDANLLGGDHQLMGKVVWFATTRGIYIGGNGGQLIPVSEGIVSIGSGSGGAGVIRNQQGQVHYLASISGVQGAVNPYVPPVADYDEQSI